MSLFNQFLINAASIYSAKIFEGFLQLALLTFILSQVGREYYAAALLIISVEATIDLARGGIQKATFKYIAEYNAIDDISGAIGILSSSTAMQSAIGILGFSACLIIAPYTSSLFALPNQMQSEAQWATLLLGIGVAVSFSISPWHNSVAAQERYDFLSLTTIGGKIFRALLTVGMLLLEVSSLISIVLATIAGNLIERLSCFLIIKHINPRLKFNFSKISYKYLKIIFKFSFFDFFHTLSGFLFGQGSLYIAAHFISLNAVAGLGIIGNITSITSLVMLQSAQMLVPVASRLKAQGQNEKLRAIIIHSTTVIVFAGGIVMSGLVPWMSPLLIVWLGASYSELANPAILLISAAFLVNSLTCIHNCLGGLGKVAVDGISNTACTILGLAIGIFLITLLGMGLNGLVIGLLITRLSRFIFISWYGARIFNFPLFRFLWTSYLRTYLLIIIVCMIGWVSEVSVNSWILLIFAGVVSSTLYFVSGLFLIVDSGDRIRFKQAVSISLGYFKG